MGVDATHTFTAGHMIPILPGILQSPLSALRPLERDTKRTEVRENTNG